MRTEDIEYHADGARLVGYLAVDDTRPGKRPGVLIAPEGGGLVDLTKSIARRLAEAGFTVEAERRFDIALDPPLPDLAHRYAQLSLQRMRHGAEGRIGADDLTALEALADTVLDRDDLTVRAARTVLLGRRPSLVD